MNITKGRMLRICRVMAGLTQEQAAIRLHVERSTVQRSEMDRATVLDEVQAWQVYGGIPQLQKLRDAAEATILRIRASHLQPVY